MADLNALLKDIKDNRLAWLSIRREKEEAFFAGVVEQVDSSIAAVNNVRVLIDQIKDGYSLMQARLDLIAVDIEALKAKRGPGRPPKEAA